jgi:hypothetical protein
MTEFKEWAKIARLNREIVITEKIDGTNGCIFNGADGEFLVGSRTRWITPEQDNYGFARWAYEHKEELQLLGEGYHYGEWWGSGIQRGYGLVKGDKRFSLFNVGRWEAERPSCCECVPILYRGLFSEGAIKECLEDLKINGSKVSPFMNPEGVVIFHTASRTLFKVTIIGDEKPKGSKE